MGSMIEMMSTTTVGRSQCLRRTQQIETWLCICLQEVESTGANKMVEHLRGIISSSKPGTTYG
jgi:hypothetical protein